MSQQEMTTPFIDLLIIGAGPAGLATAVAAIHRGARNVVVVEQAKALRTVGQHLDVLPNAVRALSALSPSVLPLLQPYMVESEPHVVRAVKVSAKGQLIQEIRTQGGQVAHIKWWQLQRLLYHALPDNRVVVLAHRLVDLKRHPDYVTAVFAIGEGGAGNEFKNWDEGDANGGVERVASGVKSKYFETCGDGLVQCRAKIIIGADGINSVSRKCIYRQINQGWERYGRPVYSGFVRVGAWGIADMEEADLRVLDEKYQRNAIICLVCCEQEE